MQILGYFLCEVILAVVRYVMFMSSLIKQEKNFFCKITNGVLNESV